MARDLTAMRLRDFIGLGGLMTITFVFLFLVVLTGGGRRMRRAFR